MIYDAVNKKRNHFECELRCCLFVMGRIVLTNAIYAIATALHR